MKNNAEQSKSKPNINWYPGHMNKAIKLMKEKMQLVDVVFEIRDARMPHASKNPVVDTIINQKPRLIILSKKDKAVNIETNKWISHLESADTLVIACDLLNDDLRKIILDSTMKLMAAKIARFKARGIRPRAFRAMVIGVPNVGKSTFLNQIAHKKMADVANKAGVTRSLQWYNVDDKLEILDTPGILWPKFEDQEIGMCLALLGSINDDIIPKEDIVIWAIEYILKKHASLLEQRYKVNIKQNANDVLTEIAKNRGLLASDNQFDMHRVVNMVLKELRDNKLGSISWECVDENLK